MSEQKALPGRFVWRELMTTDVEASKKFYTELFGWTITEHDMPGVGKYTMVQAGTKGLGGMMPFDAKQGLPSHWMSYISVQDLDASLAQARQLGAEICVPATDIPGVGRFGVVTDPQGAQFSPFQEPREAAEDGQPAAGEFCWSELLTTDPQAAASFYTAMFGWTAETHDMGPMGTYWLFRRGGKDLAGALKMPPGAEHPPYWLPYVAVESVDQSAARAEDLGGKIWVQPQDIPGIGRFSVIEDATGAYIAVYKSAHEGKA